MNETSETLIFKNAVILDGTGVDPVSGGTVVVEKERIKEVLVGSPGLLPAAAQVVDCRGQTLLPGLIDAHVHICAVEANLTELKRRSYPSVTVVRTLKVLEDCLAQGFTTVRDMGGADPGFRLALDQGLVPGPRLQVAGKGLSQTGGHGDSRLPTEAWSPIAYPIGMGGTITDGVDACRRAAREQLRQGVDFIKVMAGGGCMSPTDEIDTTQYSLEELRAVVWEAASAGKYVAAHCYSDQSIINCVIAGVRTIEHGNLGTEKAARAIKEAGACLVPTIVTYETMAEMGQELGVPGIYLRKILMARDHGMQALEAAWRAGCTIGSGSDCLGPMQRFKGRELEIQARIMGPMGAIVAATKTNAQILRREKELGTIEAGKLADLILLDGDPLADISIFQNYREKITIILQGGRFCKNLLS